MKFSWYTLCEWLLMAAMDIENWTAAAYNNFRFKNSSTLEQWRMEKKTQYSILERYNVARSLKHDENNC